VEAIRYCRGLECHGGESASCDGADGQRVQVFKVVGVPMGQAEYVKPIWGLMERTHFYEE
jgi:hypothetical protein